jgi:hypothetical protein
MEKQEPTQRDVRAILMSMLLDMSRFDRLTHDGRRPSKLGPAIRDQTAAMIDRFYAAKLAVTFAISAEPSLVLDGVSS